MSSDIKLVTYTFESAVKSGCVPQQELVAMYERDVLPLQMVAMREAATHVMRFDTLYLTAGTQPYSLALSVLATPADRVVFIATDDATCRASVQKAVAFAGLKPECFEEHVFSEPFDAAAMVKEIYCHVVTQGGCAAMDITSGRKVMSAALSSLASQLELPQFYLSGRYLHGGFSVDVERLSVPNVTAIVRYMREMDSELDDLSEGVEL